MNDNAKENLPVPPLDKRLVARDFGAAATTYDAFAHLQRWVGEHLMQGLPACTPSNLLDLGCGTGLLLPDLTERYPDAQLFGADLSQGMVTHARKTRAVPAHWLVADAESLPLPDQSMDLVFSSLMIQWCEHLSAALAEICRVLRPGGVAAISTLAEGTLQELDMAWQQADPHAQHVNRFLPLSVIEAVAQSQSAQVEMKVEQLVLSLESPQALLRELKALGARYKSSDRRSQLTGRARLSAFVNAYEAQRGRDGVLPVTWQVVCLYFRKPL